MKTKALKKVISYKTIDILLHLIIFYIFTRNILITGAMEITIK